MPIPLLLLYFFLPPAYTNKQDLLTYLDTSGASHPVQNAKDWERRRQHILANMQEVMGPLPAPIADKPEVRIEEEAQTEKYTRKKITYSVDNGDVVPAYLFIPKAAGRHPAILCLHQTTKIGKAEPAGLGGKPNLHYAQELAERGFVALAPDYPNFGDYKIDVYSRAYVSATMKGIVNHRRAVDLLQSLPQVNRKQIGVIGHSLGGHNSLFVAAFDPRIQAIVTSCGFNAFPKYYGGNLKGWSHKGYMPRIAERYHANAREMPFDFTEVLGALAPRALFINAPTRDSNFEMSGVDDCVRAAKPVYEKIYKHSDRLVVMHPEAEHDFPPDVREKSYEFLRTHLNSIR